MQELTAIRAQTLDQFRRYDDAWLWREAEWNDAIANNYWMWYHVYEDEINHRGEIVDAQVLGTGTSSRHC
jgi:hypothetical protein